MNSIRWAIGDREADLQLLQVRLAQARSEKLQHSKAIAQRDAAERRRVREEELHLKRVGAAIRRAIRQQERRRAALIHVLAPPLANGRSSPVRCRGLEAMTRLRVPQRSHVGSDGLSSFHFRWTGRGLGQQRRKRSHRYRAGEAVRHLRYICRMLAREIEGGGLVSNISRDPEHVAGFFAALEELEYQSVADANVYVSVVVALPHELSSAEREALLAEICSVPASKELPYVGVLHAPDPAGDRRNYHAHIMLSLRPAEILDDGHYAFHIQKRSELNDGEFIAQWRAQTAEMMNAAMERAGHKRRFTPLSNAARGMAPRTKESGKSSPGAKHREREAEKLHLLTAERTWRGKLDTALQRVRTQVGTLIAQPAFDRGVVLTAAVERMQAGLAARHTQIAREREDRNRALAAARIALAGKVLKGRMALGALAARIDDAGAQLKARVARAQPSRAVDPAKVKAVAAAISDVASLAFLPLQKVGDRLELTKAAVASDEAFLLIDRFDAEPEVQAFYGKKWQEMLTELRLTIQHAREMPFTRRSDGYLLNRKAVDAGLYAAVQTAGDAADMHQVLHEGIRDWHGRQKREKDRKAKALIAAAERRSKLEALISEIEVAGPGSRPWTRDQEETVVAPFTILARAAAEGHVSICRDGARLAMGTTQPHLRKFADMLDSTRAGRWALTHLADGGTIEVIATRPWAAYWSSAPRPSPVRQDGDKGVTAGRVPSPGERDGNERD